MRVLSRCLEPAPAGLLGEEADGAISPCGEDPRLGGVESNIQHPQVSGQRVPPQHLHRHQQGVLQQVAVGERRVQTGAVPWGAVPWGDRCQHSLVHHPMADNDTAVVGAGCKERIPGVEGHCPQGLLVVPGKGT